MTWFIQTALLLLICHTSLAGRVFYSPKSGVKIYSDKGDPAPAISYKLNQNGSSFSSRFETGQVAIETARSKTKSTTEYPPQEIAAPKVLPIFAFNSEQETRTLTGSITELIPNSQIFVIALHVLKKLSTSDLELSFNLSGKDLSGFYFYGFPTASQREFNDVVLAIPKGLAGSYFPRLRLNRKYRPQLAIQAGVHYWTWQFAQAIDGKELEQKSEGSFLMIEDDKYFVLNNEKSNFTAPASSGSVIYIKDPSGNTAPVGAVQCQYDLDHPQLAGMVRVLSLANVFDQTAYKFKNLEEVKGTTLSFPDKCKPIHGRGGGGT